ncbi:hypothetical protein TWF225_006568 [Orbilia oligospora]|nr:hypothetical protein TWF225_006568 [Orbilia oligospora]KAF3265083.1 hypothetical protein TWF217_002732 [Orbilia oligospora]KAF3268045.1 hypothetical protein TWF128_008060 [Orbilia oligospora]
MGGPTGPEPVFDAYDFPANRLHKLDWAVTTSSNINAAQDRSQFVRYQKVHMLTKEGHEIYGYGDIRLLVPTMSNIGRDGVALIELHRVSHIPSLEFNVLGLPMINQYGLLMHSQPARLFLNQERSVWAYVDKLTRPRLRLLGRGKDNTTISAESQDLSDITMGTNHLEAVMSSPFHPDSEAPGDVKGPSWPSAEALRGAI